MSTIARGTVVNLGTRVAAIALGVSITVLTARMGTDGPRSVRSCDLGRDAAAGAFLGLWRGAGAPCLSRGRAAAGYSRRDDLGVPARWAPPARWYWPCWSMASTGVYGLLWILALGAPLLLLPSSLSGSLVGPGPHGADRPRHRRGSASDLALLRRLLDRRSGSDADKVVAMLLSWALARLVVGLCRARSFLVRGGPA